MKKFPIFAILSMVFLAAACGSNPIKVKCPDGRIVFSYKNPEKQYPAYVKSNQNTLKGTINVLDKVKLADIDASTKTSVTELRNKLNDTSARFEIIAKAAYLQYNQDPCGSNAEYYKILNQMLELEKLRNNLEETLKSGGIGGTDEKKVANAISEYRSKSTSLIL